VRTVLLVSIFLLVHRANSQIRIGSSFNAKVVAIIDGDTYDVVHNNTKFRVRMNGIDAPERSMPYYSVAKQYLSNAIFGKLVNVQVLKLDRNKRLIAHTFLNGIDISASMLQAGMAWHFAKYYPSRTYAQLRQKAKLGRLGLWAQPNAIAPWDYRKVKKQKRVNSFGRF
jgi:micrococcal nuclease